MRSNFRNGINLGADGERPTQRHLTHAVIASYTFAAGLIGCFSVTQASATTARDAFRSLYEARLDETLGEAGLFELLPHIDPGLFMQETIREIGWNLSGVRDAVLGLLPETEGGFINSVVDNPATKIAADLIKESENNMEWMGPILTTVALGGTVVAAAYALSKASSAFKGWFMSSTEEYFEKRRALLVSGQAVKSDILETRERALRAYAGLHAFERRGPQADLLPADVDFARLALADLPLGQVLTRLEQKLTRIEERRLREIEEAVYRGEDPAPLGRPRTRDLIREVIMDRSPTVLDPFAPGVVPTPT